MALFTMLPVFLLLHMFATNIWKMNLHGTRTHARTRPYSRSAKKRNIMKIIPVIKPLKKPFGGAGKRALLKQVLELEPGHMSLFMTVSFKTSVWCDLDNAVQY